MDRYNNWRLFSFLLLILSDGGGHREIWTVSLGRPTGEDLVKLGRYINQPRRSSKQ